MSSFLFTMVEGGGNVPAQMSIARRLAARGHAVHVLGDSAIAGEAAMAGCSFHPFVHAPQQNMRDKAADAVRDWEPSSPAAQIRRVGERLMFGPAALYARDLLETAARVRPDALAVDCLVFGGMIGAEKAGIPAALLVHFPMHPPGPGVTPFGLGLKPVRGPLGYVRDRALFAAMRRLFRFGLAPVNAARRELGLAPLTDVFDQLRAFSRSLILTARAFDFVPPDLPANVVYVGPQLDDPAWAGGGAAPVAADAGAPLVVVSLGSTYQGQERAFARIVTALGRLPVQGVATLGPLDPPKGRVPRNVTVARVVAHGAVLPRAAAVVCHGGHGTVMKALAHGLPLVVLPFGRDQKDNAARVEVSGAGLALPAGAGAARIARAVRRVLEEPGFAARAKRMAAIIARDVAADRAVAEMEALAARCQETDKAELRTVRGGGRR